MSLKDKLRSLIESTFMSKKSFISNQAMPGSAYESYEYENNQDVAFVAPTDGYLTIGSTPDNDGISSIVSWGDIETSIQNTAGTPTLGDLAISVPMRKGSTKYFSIKAPRFIRFFSTVGGGLNSIIQALGGGLCLLSHLSKRFSNSAAVKQCRQMNERHRRLPLAEIGYILLPLMMVISRFQHQATGETPIHLRLRTHQVKSNTKCQQSLPRMLAHLSFVKKVTQSMFLSEEQQVLAGIPEPLSSLWGNRSFCVGGAL